MKQTYFPQMKHEGAASTQRPPLTSVEVRTHPDAQPRFPLFPSANNYFSGIRLSSFDEFLVSGSGAVAPTVPITQSFGLEAVVNGLGLQQM